MVLQGMNFSFLEFNQFFHTGANSNMPKDGMPTADKWLLEDLTNFPLSANLLCYQNIPRYKCKFLQIKVCLLNWRQEGPTEFDTRSRSNPVFMVADRE